jgi:AcrR family transcriptional regulator
MVSLTLAHRLKMRVICSHLFALYEPEDLLSSQGGRREEMPQAVHMRSVPKQERGERRMQRLLDAAERTFAEVGYKTATTNEIAARAQTSIGTLYRFFPNKAAIVQHLMERYVQELHIIHEKMSQPEVVTLPLVEMIDCLIDPLVELKSTHPGLVSLFVGPHAALQLPAEFQQLLDESLLHLETFWAKRFPHLDAESRHLSALVFFQIRQALLALAFSLTSPSQEQVIKEVKTNLFRYLEPMDQGGAPPALSIE